MNPFDPYTDGSPVATAGPASSFWDNVTSAFERTQHIDTTLAIPADVSDEWNKSIRAYQARTGENPFRNPDIASAYVDIENTLNAIDARYPRRTTGQYPDQVVQKTLELNQRMAELNDPTIKPLQTILRDVLQRRQDIIQRSEVVDATSGGAGKFFGGLIGGLAGMLTSLPQHPEQIPALFAGGFGKTAAIRIATEVGVLGATQYAVTKLDVQPIQRAFGEPETDPLEAAITAGLLGGLIRGGVEGVGAVGARLFHEPAVPEVRAALEAQPDNPIARAGISLLDDHESFRVNNPYGETLAGARRFTGEVTDIYSTFRGTDTSAIALARSMPDTVDFTFDNLDFHTQVAREQAPALFDQLTEASRAVAELDTRIAEAVGNVDSLRVSDAVARIDEPAGQLVRSFEEDLTNPQLTAPAREAIQKKIDQVVQTLGEANVARELKNAQIAPRKELQTLRASRKAAARNFRDVRNQFDEVLAQVRAQELVKNLVQKPASFALSKVAERQHLPVPEALRYDAVEATSRAVDVATEAVQASVEAPVLALENAEGKIDLGDGIVLDKNTVMFDTAGNETTVGKLFAELQADEALVEAMRVCSL